MIMIKIKSDIAEIIVNAILLAMAIGICIYILVMIYG